MGQILGPRSHASIATMVRFLLAITIEIWDRECGPFKQTFTVFAILCQVGNTISPWGKGPSQEGVTILAAYDHESVALELWSLIVAPA